MVIPFVGLLSFFIIGEYNDKSKHCKNAGQYCTTCHGSIA